jgi:hypothetical protein
MVAHRKTLVLSLSKDARRRSASPDLAATTRTPLYMRQGQGHG